MGTVYGGAPVITFEPRRKLSTSVLYSGGVIYSVSQTVSILGFDEAYHPGGILYWCDKKGVKSVVAKEFGCHTPSSRHGCGLPQ